MASRQFTSILIALASSAAPTAAAELPDTFLARLKALASMQSLNATLLSSRSATKVLEDWCGSHDMARKPLVTAERVRDGDKPADAAIRTRLNVGPDEAVKYRHVRLTCGGRTLSEADNWYVPARLSPEMNRQLDETETPFGKVVAPLHPSRETFAVEMRWSPLPAGWEVHIPPPDRPAAALDVPLVLFEHRAVLYDPAHRPFSEVDEHYTSAVLDFGRP